MASLIVIQSCVRAPGGAGGEDGVVPSMLRRYAGVVYDPVTAYYNLGNGSRSYLPYLMRFCAPDVRSPFGVGGVNTYAYCKGDPINYADPDGHVPVASLESLAARAALRAMEGASEKVSLPVHEIEKDLAAEGPLFKRIQHALWQSPMPRAAFAVDGERQARRNLHLR